MQLRARTPVRPFSSGSFPLGLTLSLAESECKPLNFPHFPDTNTRGARGHTLKACVKHDCPQIPKLPLTHQRSRCICQDEYYCDVSFIMYLFGQIIMPRGYKNSDRQDTLTHKPSSSPTNVTSLSSVTLVPGTSPPIHPYGSPSPRGLLCSLSSARGGSPLLSPSPCSCVLRRLSS